MILRSLLLVADFIKLHLLRHRMSLLAQNNWQSSVPVAEDDVDDDDGETDDSKSNQPCENQVSTCKNAENDAG